MLGECGKYVWRRRLQATKADCSCSSWKRRNVGCKLKEKRELSGASATAEVANESGRSWRYGDCRD